jgi:predicted ATPase
LSCLVTSRQSLGLPGEREYPLAPMATPNGHGSPERLNMFESVRLFVDRAQAVRPDFQVTSQNAPAVAELCDRLEGIPLAIELAAARSSVFTPAQMLFQLERRFDFLVSRRRPVIAHHATLKAAMDWSFDQLPPEVQRFFARLSVFRGGWTAEAAGEVCDEAEALDCLTQLRDCSLILAEESTEGMRFRMLETMREYTEERLSVEDSAAAKRRHLAFFLRLAEEAQWRFRGPEQAASLETVVVEHDNLRSALAYALTVEEGAEIGLWLTCYLKWFWSVRGHLSEGRKWLKTALEAGRAGARTELRARALSAAGDLAFNQGDFAQARIYYEEGLAICREVGSERGTAAHLDGLACVAWRQGDYAVARSLFEASIQMYRELGDSDRVIGMLNSLGNVDYYQSDYASASSLFNEALAGNRQSGNREWEATNLEGLGNVALAQGNYVLSRTLFEVSLAIRHELKNKQHIAGSLNNLGRTALAQGDYASAITLFKESVALSRELEDRQGAATALNNLGEAVNAQGEYAAAQNHLDEALFINRQSGNFAWEAYNLKALGDVARNLTDYSAARSLYKQSMTIRRAGGEKRSIADSLESLAGLQTTEGKHEQAARLWAAAQHLREEIGAPAWPRDKNRQDLDIAETRAALGEEAFAAAWEAGRAMTWEQAVEYALSAE